MSIIRVSNTIIRDLGHEILNKLKIDEKNITLDTSIFPSAGSGKNVSFRDIIDRVFPVLSIIDYTDTEKELDKYGDKISPEVKQALMVAIKAGVQRVITSSVKITSTQLKANIIAIVDNTSLSSAEVAVRLKQLFSKSYYLEDSASISSNADIIVAPNYVGVGPRINKQVNASLIALGRNEKLGEYLDAGHSAAQVGDSDRYVFNSPKLFSVLFDIASTPGSSFKSKKVDLDAASIIYATKTEQLKHSVKVTKEFGDGFLKIFAEIGGSVVTLENSAENQRRGTSLEKQEKFGKNSAVLTKLRAQFANLKDGLSKTHSSRDISAIIRSMYKYAGSPSGIDYIVQNVIDNIKGVKTLKYKSTTVRESTTKIVTKTATIRGIAKKISKPKQSIKIDVGVTSSTASLESLLRAKLALQVRKNMGTGNRKDVLNYRTGRFAESANIERLSVSRAGMISVFYSYMRNPYGTFSDGGLQQYPKTRDPKLLISKSIREIGASLVGNRMRAILV